MCKFPQPAQQYPIGQPIFDTYDNAKGIACGFSDGWWFPPGETPLFYWLSGDFKGKPLGTELSKTYAVWADG